MLPWKCSIQYVSKFVIQYVIQNSAVATGLEKVNFHSLPEKRNAKECSNYHTTALISHANKVVLKMLQAWLQQYMNQELPGEQAGFRKGRGSREQNVNICWIMRKQGNSRKTSTSASLTMLKLWITTNCGEFRKCTGTRDQITNIRWIVEKAREFQEKKKSPPYWLS